MTKNAVAWSETVDLGPEAYFCCYPDFLFVVTLSQLPSRKTSRKSFNYLPKHKLYLLCFPLPLILHNQPNLSCILNRYLQSFESNPALSVVLSLHLYSAPPSSILQVLSSLSSYIEISFPPHRLFFGSVLSYGGKRAMLMFLCSCAFSLMDRQLCSHFYI